MYAYTFLCSFLYEICIVNAYMNYEKSETTLIEFIRESDIIGYNNNNCTVPYKNIWA